MSALTKETEHSLLEAAKNGVFENCMCISDIYEATALYNEKLISSSSIALPSMITVSWEDPYNGAWPHSVYKYIYGKQNEFPESSAKNLAEKLFIIAKSVDINRNK